MKKRPLSIRLLAFAFMMSPLGLILELYYLYQISPRYWYTVFNPIIWTPQVIAIAVATPIVGFGVWTTHRWGYFALFSYSFLILINNLAVWIMGRARSGVFERVLFSVGLLALVLFELRKEFSAPYFNPRLRRWEQASRYLTDRFQVIIKRFGTNEELFRAVSFDISETGVYIVSDRSAATGDVFAMDIVLPDGRTLNASGEAVWIHGGGDANPPGFGCRFTAYNQHFKHDLRTAIRKLHAAEKPR